MNQLISSAVGEKLSAPMTEDYLARAKRVREYAKTHSGEEITKRLNQVYEAGSEDASPEIEHAALDVLRQERW